MKKTITRSSSFLLTLLIAAAGMLPAFDSAGQCTPPSVVSHKDSSRCGPGAVVLEATPSAGSINWYSGPTGGSPLSTGNSFTTPSISTTTTYYAAAAAGSGGFTIYNTGLPSFIQNNPFITTSAGWGLRFTVTQDCFIDSVGVYPIGTGTLSVRIWNATTQAVVYTSPVSPSMTGTGTTKVMVYVGTPSLPPGNYIMGIGSFTGLTDLRNEGFNAVAYPFTCPALSVTTGSQGFTSPTNNVYYFCYDWRVRVGAPCESARVPVVATVKSAPQVALGNDTTICPGITYTLNAANAGATYAWNTGASTQSINVSSAGTYSVLVTASNGCSGSDAINITNGIVPVNNLPATTDLCEGDVVNLNAGNSGSTFLWTPGGATTQTINTDTGGTFQVRIRSVNGCEITSNTQVMLRPLPVANLSNDTSICKGAQITLDAGNTGYSFLWNTGATTQTIDVTDSGTYSVTITTPYSCTLTDEQHVAYLPSPYAEGFNFIPMFYEDLGKVQFFPLNPVNTHSYEWDFGDGTPVSTQMNPFHIYAAGGDYIVTLTVFNGCGQYSVSLPINVDLPTGMVTLGREQAEVLLFPNPARNQLTISNKSSDIRMQEVTVYNAVGAVVYRHKSDSPDEHKINVGRFASGMYSVRILSDKGYISRKFEVLR